MRTKLFVGGLGDDKVVSADDLRSIFEEFGTVNECECIKNFAFVHMEDEQAANEALRNVPGIKVKGRTLKVEKSESKGRKKPSQKLFVGNIALGTTNEELKKVFEQFTPVLEADVIKNYGFVHIEAEAGKAKINEILRELDGFKLNGSDLRVQLSTSGIRTRPGMGGDKCYRCGREGHWSKECPDSGDFPSSGRGGRGGGFGGGGRGFGNSGGPMRSGGRGGSGGGGRGGGMGQSRSDPYPKPNYMRDRMMGGGGGQSNYETGPYGRGGGGGGVGPRIAELFDRRPQGDSYGGSRDMGGPMRGPDPYGSAGNAYGGPEPLGSGFPKPGGARLGGDFSSTPGYGSTTIQNPMTSGYGPPSGAFASQPSYGAQRGGGYSASGYTTGVARGAPSGSGYGPDPYTQQRPAGLGAAGMRQAGGGGYGGVMDRGAGAPPSTGGFGSVRGDYRMY